MRFYDPFPFDASSSLTFYSTVAVSSGTGDSWMLSCYAANLPRYLLLLKVAGDELYRDSNRKRRININGSHISGVCHF